MIAEGFCATTAFALTGGPSQPEFTSFEPVATTNMVNEFTGDFTYNIPLFEVPGPHGSGYPVSLSYHSGESQEGIGSWVGYGWTLNAGAINRMKRGFPDDRKGAFVENWNHTTPNQTTTVSPNVAIETYSQNGDVTTTTSTSGLNASLRYNNYRGFGTSLGTSLTTWGATLGYGISDGVGSFSLSINPKKLLNKVASKRTKRENTKNEDATSDSKGKRMKETVSKLKNSSLFQYGLSKLYLSTSYGMKYAPTFASQYSGVETKAKVGVMATPSVLQLGLSTNLTGRYIEQTNEDMISRQSYGYMYSKDAESNPTTLMDYYKEKDTPWDARDVFLGIPFSNVDQFIMTGEGLAGGFRLHQKNVGHFFPPKSESGQDIREIGREVGLGVNMDLGTELGVGYEETRQTRYWPIDGESSDFTFANSDEDEATFFRFNNDLGGSVSYGALAIERAKFIDNFVKMPFGIAKTMNNGKRSGRNSLIEYHTNQEMSSSDYEGSNGKQMLAYTRRADIDAFVNRNDPTLQDQIGEIAMCSETGLRYVYGLPTYSRNEHSLAYDVGDDGRVYHNHLVEKTIPTNYQGDKLVGTVDNTPYATTFLLTEIHSPEYIDVGLDGPTADDIGGWTKFSYQQTAGGASSNWYKWRIPYKGLQYDKGSISSTNDDVASVSWGEKEIYYLQQIETKTHYAIFHTSTRLDAYPAIDDEEVATGDLTANIPQNNPLQKLDKIELFSKDDPTTPIQTVNFEYDYSLVPGTPDASGNSISTTGGNLNFQGTRGKLTLKRMWFEFGRIKDAKITPYDFEYEYAHLNGGITYPTPYNHLNDHGNQLSSNSQNPNYDLFNLDVWGNYQTGGAALHDEMRIGLDQQDLATFDPAAWQLKRIIMPSGGEIHIQYEQDDYAFVQDQLAMEMIKLSETINEQDINTNRFYLSLADELGISTPVELQAYADFLDNYFKKSENQKIYFKFLYELLESSSSVPGLDCANTEFITGYVHFEKAEYDQTSNRIYIQLGKDGPKYLPHQVCKDFYKTQRRGKVANDCSTPEGLVMNSNDALGNIVGLLQNVGNLPTSPNCERLNPEYSYFKIPLPPTRGKKGGGVRVKRLLMYDTGLEAGAEVVYGTEYIYKQFDPKYGLISSGVATNEPQEIRSENPLVHYMPRKKQGLLSRIVSGRDTEQGEGPLGESLLPGSSVGYSTVYAKNIHSGKTNTGFSESTFYTTRDFPYNKYYEALDERGTQMTNLKKSRSFRPTLALGPVKISNKIINLSQGFKFIQYAISGNPKRIATYSGDYNEPWNESARSLVTSQEYIYYEPGEQIPVMTELGQITYANPGLEQEVVCEQRQVVNTRTDLKAEVDASIAYAGPIPIVQASASPNIERISTKARTHAITKVVKYPVIQKAVRTYQDGAYQTVENVAFSPITGQPIVNRSYDAFHDLTLGSSSSPHNGIRTSYSFLAADKYEALGQKAQNIRKRLQSGGNLNMLNAIHNGRYFIELSANSGNVCDAIEFLQEGDFIRAQLTNSSHVFYHIGEKRGGQIEVFPSIHNNTQSLPSTSSLIDEIEVIRSGFNNVLSSSVGNITTYGKDETSQPVYQPISQPKLDAENAFAQLLSIANPSTVNGNGTVDIPSDIIVGSDCDSEIYMERTSANYVTLEYHNENGVILCQETLYDPLGSGAGGHFEVSTTDGISQLVFYSEDNPCTPQEVNCIQLCQTGNGGWTFPNVLQANATVLSDDWGYDEDIYREISYSNDPYETGEKGKWRLLSSYVYKEETTSANAPGSSIYDNAGIFSEDLKLFSWNYEGRNDPQKWIQSTIVTQYSPHGEPLEEQNALGIYSCSKFGYSQNVPYIVAQNTDYDAVQFESFENVYDINGISYLEDGLVLPNPSQRILGPAHTGRGAYELTSATNTLSLKPFTLSAQHQNEGTSIKFWLRDIEWRNNPPIELVMESTNNSHIVPSNEIQKIAQVEYWTLYEVRINPWMNILIGEEVTPKLMYVNSGNNTPIQIDDIRLQPLAAQVNCYVYDTQNLRLQATFDDQHFGVLNQYNPEGQLIRRIIETERGRKTVEETQYNIPKRPR